MPISDAQAIIAGLVDPVLARTHLLPLVGLGLLAGRMLPRPRILLTAAFAVGLGVGLLAIAWGAGETPATDILLAAAGTCGALAALDSPVPPWLALPGAALVGSAVGLDSPPESISLREAVLILIGTGWGGVAALALVVAAAAVLGRWPIALRVAGSWTAAIAILVLARRWVG
jgi:hydrogenase/urease accessory protein HupE